MPFDLRQSDVPESSRTGGVSGLEDSLRGADPADLRYGLDSSGLRYFSPERDPVTGLVELVTLKVERVRQDQRKRVLTISGYRSKLRPKVCKITLVRAVNFARKDNFGQNLRWNVRRTGRLPDNCLYLARWYTRSSTDIPKVLHIRTRVPRFQAKMQEARTTILCNMSQSRPARQWPLYGCCCDIISSLLST